MTASKIYGLIGYPLAHSLSPLMHNAAFSHLKIGAEYKLFSLKQEELEGFLKNASCANLAGLNVTIPFKEKVIAFLESISPEAKLIGAVNTIKISGNKLEGFNTDARGFFKSLTSDLNFSPQNKNIFILGAGGASRAVCVSLAKASPKKIVIFDIDQAKSEALVNRLKENFEGVDILAAGSIERLGEEKFELLVNTTPIGMKKDDPCIVKDELINPDMLVYDLIYNPQKSALLKLSLEKGAKISNGLGMLLYQGAAAFEIWTGLKAPVSVMRRALMKGAAK